MVGRSVAAGGSRARCRTAGRRCHRAPHELCGSRAVAGRTVLPGARARSPRWPSWTGRWVLGAVVTPRGRLRLVLMVTVEDGRIISHEMIGDPVRLRGLALAVLDG